MTVSLKCYVTTPLTIAIFHGGVRCCFFGTRQSWNHHCQLSCSRWGHHLGGQPKWLVLR